MPFLSSLRKVSGNNSHGSPGSSKGNKKGSNPGDISPQQQQQQQRVSEDQSIDQSENDSISNGGKVVQSAPQGDSARLSSQNIITVPNIPHSARVINSLEDKVPGVPGQKPVNGSVDSLPISFSSPASRMGQPQLHHQSSYPAMQQGGVTSNPFKRNPFIPNTPPLNRIDSPGNSPGGTMLQHQQHQGQTGLAGSSGSPFLGNSGKPDSPRSPKPYPWSRQPLYGNRQPFPRYGHASNNVATRSGDIFVFSGLEGNDAVNDLWVINANSLVSSQLPNGDCPSPRVGHAGLLIGNAFVIFGGDTKIGKSQSLDNSLYFMHTNTHQWTTAHIENPLPCGRYGHALAVIGPTLYMFGGQAEHHFFNDLYAYDFTKLYEEGHNWTSLSSSPASIKPEPRTNHTLIAWNGKLYLFGGTNGQKWFNDTWCYDPVTNAWTDVKVTGFLPTPCEGHATALVDDIMYIFGGRSESGSDLGSLSALKLSNLRWFTFHNMGPAPSPRSGHSMTVCGSNIVVLGGEPATGQQDDCNFAYILDTTKIRYPSAGPPPQQHKKKPSFSQIEGSDTSSLDHHNATLQLRDGVRISRTLRSPVEVVGAPANGHFPSPTSAIVGDGSLNSSTSTFPSASALYNPSRTSAGFSSQEPVIEEQAGGSGVTLEKVTSSSSSSQKRGLVPAGTGTEQLSVTTSGKKDIDEQQQESDNDKACSPIKVSSISPHGEDVDKLKAALRWYDSELLFARNAGYTIESPPPTWLKSDGVSTKPNIKDPTTLAAIITIREELDRVRKTLKEHSDQESIRVAEAERQRDAALHEVAELRVKSQQEESSDSMQAKLVKVSNTNTELEQQVGKLKRELDAVNCQLSVANDGFESMKGKLETIGSNQQDLDKEGQDGSKGYVGGAEYHELQAKMLSLEAQLRAEVDAKQELETLGSKRAAQIHHLESSLSVLDPGALAATQLALGSATERCNLLASQLEQASAGRSENQEEIDRLLGEAGELRSRNEHLESQLEEVKQELELARKQAHTASVALSSGIKSALDRQSCKEWNALVDEHVKNLEARVASLQEIHDESVKAAEEARTLHANLSGEYTTLKKAHLDSVQETSSLHERIKDLTNDVNSHRNLLEESQSDANKHRELLEMMTAKHSALQVALEEHQTDRSTREVEEITELRQEVLTSKRKIEQVEKEYKSAVDYVKSTDSIVIRMKEELSKYRGKNSSLKNELDESRRKLTVMTSSNDKSLEVTQLRREIEIISDKLHKAEIHSRKLQDDQDQIQNERDELKLKLSRLERQQLRQETELKDEIERIIVERSRMEARAKDAERQVRQLLEQTGHAVENYHRLLEEEEEEEGDVIFNSSTLPVEIQKQPPTSNPEVVMKKSPSPEKRHRQRRRTSNMPGQFPGAEQQYSRDTSRESRVSRSNNNSDNDDDDVEKEEEKEEEANNSENDTTLTRPHRSSSTVTNNNRASMALESLAQELDQLRSQWQSHSHSSSLSKEDSISVP